MCQSQYVAVKQLSDQMSSSLLPCFKVLNGAVVSRQAPALALQGAPEAVQRKVQLEIQKAE